MSDNALAHYAVSLQVIEEHTKELAVVERDDKLQIPVFVWAFVVGFAAGESRTFAGFRRSDNSTADVTISPGGFYHRLTPSLATVYVSRDDELLALRFAEDEGEEPEEDIEEEEEPGEDEEEEKAEEEPEEVPEDESSEEAPSLGLSVSAPDSIARSETACFEVTVWNHDSDATAVTVTFEISDITESSTVEIAAGDSYASRCNAEPDVTYRGRTYRYQPRSVRFLSVSVCEIHRLSSAEHSNHVSTSTTAEPVKLFRDSLFVEGRRVASINPFHFIGRVAHYSASEVRKAGHTFLLTPAKTLSVQLKIQLLQIRAIYFLNS